MRAKHHLTALCALACAAAASPASALPGQLDPSFGQGGRVTIPLVGTGQAAIVQPDNKILILNRIVKQATLVRLLSTGAVDPGFGSNGVVGLSFSSIGTFPSDLALQSDGKLVVVGTVQLNNFADPSFGGFVARLNPDGTSDATFGANGVVRFGPKAVIAAVLVLLQDDGKILIGADGGRSNAGQEVLRLNTDGTLDPTFGTGGIAVAAATSEVSALALQSDGKVIVGSFIGFPFRTDENPTTVRLQPNGAVDTTTTPGTVVANADNNGFAVQPNGSYVSYVFNSQPANRLQRDTPANTRDPSFASPLIDASGGFQGSSLLLQPDGKVLAGGQALAAPGGSAVAFALARVGTNGRLDSGFGTGGTATTSFPRQSGAGVGALALQTDGKIVAAGFANSPSGSSQVLAVARYLAK